MSLIKVKTKYQVNLPNALSKALGLHVGDILDASVKNGSITLTPRNMIEQRLKEGEEDLKKGRFIGPFNSAKNLISALKKPRKKRSS